MKFAAIAMQVRAFPVQWMCKKLGVSPQRVLRLAIAPRIGTEEKRQRNHGACKGCFFGEPKHLRESTNLSRAEEPGSDSGREKGRATYASKRHFLPQKALFCKNNAVPSWPSSRRESSRTRIFSFLPKSKVGHRYPLHHDSRSLYLSRLDHRPFFSTHRRVVSC